MIFDTKTEILIRIFIIIQYFKGKRANGTNRMLELAITEINLICKFGKSQYRKRNTNDGLRFNDLQLHEERSYYFFIKVLTVRCSLIFSSSLAPCNAHYCTSLWRTKFIPASLRKSIARLFCFCGSWVRVIKVELALNSKFETSILVLLHILINSVEPRNREPVEKRQLTILL